MGFAFQNLDCFPAGRFDPCAADVELVIPDNASENVEFIPYAVWAGYRCSVFTSDTDWKRAVTDALLTSQGNQIGAELWRGDIARAEDHPNQYLTDPASDLVSSAAKEVVDALACLEQYLGECGAGQQGMIHATRQLVTHWNEKGLVRRDGQRFYTAMDTLVVPDGGYDGSGPAARGDAAPDAPGATQWAYATGLVTVRLEPMSEATIPNPIEGGDPIRVPPVIGAPDTSGFDRATNTGEARAERRAAATWSGCCHAAVEVDLPVCSEIGGS